MPYTKAAQTGPALQSAWVPEDGWIDAHHHLWHYAPADFPWISARMQQLKQDFTLAQLEPLAAAHHVAGTIAVQARQTLEETRWLLDLAHRSTLIRGVVGWVPLIDPQVEHELEELAQDTALVGIRHILHDEPDPDYMLRPAFNRGLEALTRHDLRYDLLIFPQHLSLAIELVDRHRSQQFILDHLAKPAIAHASLSAWARHLKRLAERPNVACKVSGLVTEADWQHWTLADLQPCFDIALEAFGPERLMYGSDWPVLNLAADYSRWQRTVSALLAPLSQDEARAIARGTAERIYGLAGRRTTASAS